MADESRHALTTFRRENTSVQEMHIAGLVWAKLSPAQRADLFPLRVVDHLVREGRRLKPVLVSYDYNKDQAPSGWIFENMAREIYYAELLGKSFSQSADLSVEVLLKAWQLLSSLAHASYERTPDRRARTEKHFLEHAPRWKSSSLVHLLTKAFQWDPRMGTQVIRFLTYCGDKNQNLWAQPLVSCGNEEVVITFASLMYGNLLRIVERWLRQGGVDISVKGYAFEKQVRDELKQYFLGSMLSGNTMVWDEAIRLPLAGAGVEEVDVVLLMGNILLIGEVKCLLAPADSIEYLRYFDALSGAARQIARKKAAIEADISGFFSLLGSHIKVPSNVRVVSMVVTNSPVGVGFPIDGIPVADLRTLQVFADGSYVEWSIFDKGRVTKEKRSSIYSSFEQAQQRLEAFLACPPYVVITSPFLRERSVPLPSRKRDNKAARVICLDVQVERPTEMEAEGEGVHEP